jgi:HlyD family secretion protein
MSIVTAEPLLHTLSCRFLRRTRLFRTAYSAALRARLGSPFGKNVRHVTRKLQRNHAGVAESTPPVGKRYTTVKKLLLILIAAGAALTAAAYGWHWWHERETEQVAYTVEGVQHGTIDEVVSATGRVRPRDVYVVGSEVAGKVTAVLADYNQTVAEGDVLLRLDDRLAKTRLQQADLAVGQARAAVKQAEINRDTAEKSYKRVRDMSKEVRNPEDVDIAEGKWRSADAAVQLAQLKVQEAEDERRRAEVGLRLTIVRAPVLESMSPSASQPSRPGTGVVVEDIVPSRPKRSFFVLERKVSVNQEIGSSLQGQLFALASDLQRMRVTAEVGESDIDKVRRGMKARFTVGGAGDDAPKYHGVIEDIHLMPSHEQGAVYYQVEIDADNERDPDSGDWKLRPGLTASVDIIRRSHRDAWKVPSAALNFEPNPSRQSDAARQKLARRDSFSHPDWWQTVWIRGADGKPWPIFVRTGGKGAQGEEGIQADRFTEALEWDEEVKDATALQVITTAPPPKKSIFSLPNIKF